MFKIVEMRREEYEAWCKQQVKEKGLTCAVQEELDEIVGLCRAMNYSGFGEVMERAQNIVDFLGTVQREGYWNVLTDCSNSGIYCSECQTKIFERTTPPKKKLSKFCPHCGAKMAPWDQAVRL